MADTGHRFRYNQFIKNDGWFFPNNDLDVFFDYVDYNSDWYPLAYEGSE